MQVKILEEVMTSREVEHTLEEALEKHFLRNKRGS